MIYHILIGRTPNGEQKKKRKRQKNIVRIIIIGNVIT
jgi:hypothetical protein